MQAQTSVSINHLNYIEVRRKHTNHVGCIFTNYTNYMKLRKNHVGYVGYVGRKKHFIFLPFIRVTHSRRGYYLRLRVW